MSAPEGNIAGKKLLELLKRVFFLYIWRTQSKQAKTER